MSEKRYQIRTNSKRFGDVFGVYDIEQEKFVKQTNYDHGSFYMEPTEAKKLLNKLKSNIRNAWVRLYEMI